MKKIGKKIIAAILGWQVRRLRRKNKLITVAVTGSIGKTSTKFAIARVLSVKYKVRFQEGNYNDIVSVPMVYFGHDLPNIFNPLAWLAVFLKNERVIKKPYPFRVVVLELGSDAPGQIKLFKKYIRADIGVLTAITPEHMEFFDDLDAVAREEMAITQLSDKVFANKDLISEDYISQLPDGSVTYGIKTPADVRMTNIRFNGNSADFKVAHGPNLVVEGRHEQITEPQLYSICAASAVAKALDMSPSEIEAGIKKIRPVSGRMQHLKGLKGSIIIDDTYNASPEAMKGALDTLYRMNAPQKIAILGNMNELGSYSASEHKKIGEYCDPKELDLVVTIGPDANKYLAPAAKAKGCEVQPFDSPYKAGELVKDVIENGSAILVKGSQNKVFAEESIKSFLAEPKDAAKLVRQSRSWLKKKRKSFKA